MTTGYAGHLLRRDAGRSRTPPHLLHVVHGRRRLRLSHPRVALGSLIGGAMAGALLGVAYGVLVLEQREVPAVLRSYALGAAAGAVSGLALGALLSVGTGLVQRYVLPQRVIARSVWVRHRR